MTTPQPEPQPGEEPLTALYAAAALLLLTALGRAVLTAVTGTVAERIAAGARLDRTVGQVRGNLDRRGPELAGRAVRKAARAGAVRARGELGRLDLPQVDPRVDVGGVVDRLRQLVRAANDTLTRTVSAAFRQVVTFADRHDDERARVDAAQRMLGRLVDGGLLEMRDQAGRTWTVNTYLRWALEAATIEAGLTSHLGWLRGNGVDLVYVTTNPVQCRLCVLWIGKILSITGSGGPGVATAQGVDGVTDLIEVAGSVSDARAAGLLHPHCRHRLLPWVPGVTMIADAFPDERDAAERARRRVIERHIGRWEQRRAAALTRRSRDQATAKVREWRAELPRATAPVG